MITAQSTYGTWIWSILISNEDYLLSSSQSTLSSLMFYVSYILTMMRTLNTHTCSQLQHCLNTQNLNRLTSDSFFIKKNISSFSWDDLQLVTDLWLSGPVYPTGQREELKTVWYVVSCILYDGCRVQGWLARCVVTWPHLSSHSSSAHRAGAADFPPWEGGAVTWQHLANLMQMSVLSCCVGSPEMTEQSREILHKHNFTEK